MRSSAGTRTLTLEVETSLDDGLNLADADQVNISVEDAVRAAVAAADRVHAHAHSLSGEVSYSA
jgi:hypothetical protein